MLHNQKVSHLRAGLERWKSHNEVQAKPADVVLYDFLKDLLDLFHIPEAEDEDERPELPVRDVVDSPDASPVLLGNEGGNSLEATPDLL